MHAVSFLQKRGHLCAVARGHEMFEHVLDMTPARFDLLYVIYHHNPVRRPTRVIGYEMPQADARQKLGLSRQTVWKMVNRLIELGLLEMHKDLNGRDPRRNILKLTEEGVLRAREAMSAAFTESIPVPREVLEMPIGHRNRRRPELVPLVDVDGRPIRRKKRGREVAKIYTSFAWARVPGGRRGKPYKHLELLDRTVTFLGELATALGNEAPSLYTMRFTDEHDH